MSVIAPDASRARVSAEPAAQLEFVRNTADSPVNQQYYRVSTCGRYTVSKVFVAEVAIYDGWRRRGEQAEHLGSRKSFAGAVALCQRHSEANP